MRTFAILTVTRLRSGTSDTTQHKNIMKTLHPAVLLLISLCSHAIAADADIHVISCPAKIETTQSLRGELPSGWSEVSNLEIADTPKRWNNIHWLSGVSFSTGHPSDLVILAPDNSNESPRGPKFTSYWTFTDTAGAYVTCQYWQTKVELTQPLPAGFKRCEIRRNVKPADEIVSVSCSR
jgi:hypothetical protein